MQINIELVMQVLKRKNGKYTLKQLAEDLNVTEQTVQNWKNGTTQPYGVNLLNIMKLTHLKYEELWK